MMIIRKPTNKTKTHYVGDHHEKETSIPFDNHHPINPPHQHHQHHHHQQYYRAVYFPLISVLIRKVVATIF